MVFLLALVGSVVLALVVALLTREPPYECPPGKSVVATVKRHGDAGPMLVALTTASIDAEIVEEPAKSLWRRLPFLFFALFFTVDHAHEPVGPWHVVVPSSCLAEAQLALSISTEQNPIQA